MHQKVEDEAGVHALGLPSFMSRNLISLRYNIIGAYKYRLITFLVINA